MCMQGFRRISPSTIFGQFSVSFLNWHCHLTLSKHWPACASLFVIRNSLIHPGSELITSEELRYENNSQALWFLPAVCNTETYQIHTFIQAAPDSFFHWDISISLLFELGCVLEIQEAVSLPECDWSSGALSGRTGSSVVGVHRRVSEGCVTRVIPLGVCCGGSALCTVSR